MLLGALCGIFSGILKNSFLYRLSQYCKISPWLFCFTDRYLTIIFKEPLGSKYCTFLCRGNLSNAGILGLLAGFFSPLPSAAGYLKLYNHYCAFSPLEGLFYAFIFGLGTTISPVILMAGLSGKISGRFFE